MPKNIEIKNGYAICLYEGAVTLTQVAEAAKNIGASPDLIRLKSVLHDLSRIESFTFDNEQVTEAAMHVLGLLYTNKYVISCVVASDQRVSDAVHAYCKLTKRYVPIFSTLEIAKHWINRD